MTRPPSLTAAAHAMLRDVLAGPSRPAVPMAATRAAVVLAVPGAPAVSVVTTDAVRMPGSLVLGTPSSRLSLRDLGPGTPAAIGDGEVRLGHLTVRPVRWWATRSVPAARRPEALAAALDRLDALLEHERAGEVPAAVAGPRDAARLAEGGRRLAGELATAVRGGCPDLSCADDLLGLGPGLTPSGDDVVAGVLVAVRRLLPAAADDVQVAGDALALRARERTTAVSAALLEWAAAGEAVPEVLGLLEVLARGGDVRGPYAALRRVGHTSGRDLALGLRAGARAVLHLLAAPVPVG